MSQLAQKMANLRRQQDNLQREDSAFARTRRARDIKSEKQQFIDKNRYVLTVFFVFAMAIVVAQVAWILFGQETNKDPIVQYDTPEARYANALDNPNVDQLEERIYSLTANMQTLSGLLTNLESKLIATDQAEARIASLNGHLEKLNTMTNDLESKQKAVERLEERISRVKMELQLLGDLTAGIESEKRAPLLAAATIVPATQKLASRTITEQPPIVKEAPVIQTQRGLGAGTASEKKAPLLTTAAVVPATQKLAFRTTTEQPPVVRKAPVIETQRTSAAAKPEPKPVPTAKPRTAPIEQKERVVTKEPAARVTKNGPWTLNLISSPDKAYAVSFSDTARSKGVSTELQEVSVKGTPYWRVQVTGFSTQAEANASADVIRDRLGLADIWVLKR